MCEPFHSFWVFQPSPLSQRGREEQAVTTTTASHCDWGNGDSTQDWEGRSNRFGGMEMGLWLVMSSEHPRVTQGQMCRQQLTCCS